MARSTSSCGKLWNMVMLSLMEALNMNTFCSTTEMSSQSEPPLISRSSRPSMSISPV